MTHKAIVTAAAVLQLLSAGVAQAQTSTGKPGTGYVAPESPVPGASKSAPSATGLVAPKPGTPGTKTNGSAGSKTTPARASGQAGAKPQTSPQ